jgi:predicted branched-subunit amino acid permease
MTGRTNFAEGVEAIAPLLLPTATIAVAAGIAGPIAGLSSVQTLSMSVLVYFPSVMLAALELLDSGVPVAVVVLPALVSLEGPFVGDVLDARTLAGAAAALTAWWTV